MLQQPAPLEWVPPQTGDLLVESDATRTDRGGSAELEFGDGTTLVITEESLVFLRDIKGRLSTPRSRGVELVRGQADLSSLARPGATPSDVEIVMGNSRLSLSNSETVSSRAARTDDGKSKVGVYQGELSFSNGGQEIRLEQGSGAVVEGDEPPQPERLLDAPAVVGPSPEDEIAASEPQIDLDWSAPDGDVDGYTVELCRDARCGELQARVAGLDQTSWQVASPGVGTYYWRVNATSASGLDGFVTTPTRFVVTDTPRVVDTTPPNVDIGLTATGVKIAGRSTFGPVPSLSSSADDPDTEIESWLEINGERREIGDGLPTGSYDVRIVATNEADLRSESRIVSFDVDADPPTLEVERRTAPPVVEPPKKRPRKRFWLWGRRAPQAPFDPRAFDRGEHSVFWSLNGVEWRPVEQGPVHSMREPFEIRLRTLANHCLSHEDLEECYGDEVAISAADTGVGVLQITVRRAESGDRIIIEATDRVGNSSTTELRDVGD